MKRPNRNQIKFSSATRRTSGTRLWRAVHVFREERETEHVVPIPEIPRNIRLNKFSAGKETVLRKRQTHRYKWPEDKSPAEPLASWATCKHRRGRKRSLLIELLPANRQSNQETNARIRLGDY